MFIHDIIKLKFKIKLKSLSTTTFRNAFYQIPEFEK